MTAAKAGSTNGNPTVELRDVTKQFGDFTAVDDLSLAIGEGEFFTLLGPSGCGKTTTLRMVAGFEEATEGQVLIDGADVVGLPPYRRPTNTVFQSYALFPHLSVADNVAFGLRRKKVDKKEIDRRVNGELERVGLAREANRRPSQLSGGMQQRVALARALAVDPGCLLMDEPFGALDAITRMRLQEEIARIAVEREKTVLFVTHDVDESVFLADRIVLMKPDPGRVHRVIDVPLARPRSRTSPVFVATRGEVFRELVALHAVDAA
jgi:ABC-type Fe3+/spermidine/putrescine transport system ATPase subunit